LTNKQTDPETYTAESIQLSSRRYYTTLGNQYLSMPRLMHAYGIQMYCIVFCKHN